MIWSHSHECTLIQVVSKARPVVTCVNKAEAECEHTSVPRPSDIDTSASSSSTCRRRKRKRNGVLPWYPNDDYGVLP